MLTKKKKISSFIIVYSNLLKLLSNIILLYDYPFDGHSVYLTFIVERNFAKKHKLSSFIDETCRGDRKFHPSTSTNFIFKGCFSFTLLLDFFYSLFQLGVPLRHKDLKTVIGRNKKYFSFFAEVLWRHRTHNWNRL